MILPLELLVAHDGNGYELAAAAMRRAVQINLAGDEELLQNRGKIVSLAIKQILTKKVRYQLEG
jgi:DNA-directed RNA polymerase subunit omega